MLETIKQKAADYLARLGVTTRNEEHFKLLAGSTQSALVLGAPQPITLPPSIKQRYRQLPPPLRQGAPLILRKREKPLWHQKGWVQSGRGTNGAGEGEYRGHFKACGQEWRGVITVPYAGSYTSYIRNPPASEIQSNTYHWACFTYQSAGAFAGYYRVHYHRNPHNLSHAITTVEDLLAQAVGKSAARRNRR